MRPRQKFLRLSQGPILVLPKHKKLVDDHCEQRGVTINQAVRDIIDHADIFGFFNGNGITNGQVSPPKGVGE